MKKNKPVDPNMPVAKMFEADADISAWITATVQHIKATAKGNPTYAFARATSIAAQVFMSHGGKLDAAEHIGDCFKVGIISTLGAFRDYNKVNHRGTVSTN